MRLLDRFKLPLLLHFRFWVQRQGGFGEQQDAGNGHRVLEGYANHFGRINDASFHQVYILPG